MTEMEQEDRAYKHFTVQENWRNCAAIYAEQHAFTIHYDHRHGPKDKVRTFDLESDLIVNECRRILGEAWADS